MNFLLRKVGARKSVEERPSLQKLELPVNLCSWIPPGLEFPGQDPLKKHFPTLSPNPFLVLIFAPSLE